MFRNHFKIAIRNLTKNSFFSLLNLTGLAVGIAVSLALMLFVKEELSFDKYHSKASNIYRAALDVSFDDMHEKWASAPNIAGPVFSEEISEVQGYCRFLHHNFGKTAFLHLNGDNFAEKKFYWVDNSVFDLFDIPLLQGDPRTALSRPNKVVLSEQTARKIFGNLNPMGQVIKLDNDRELEVSGVFKEFPDNSIFECNVMGSFVSQNWAAKRLVWSNCSFETYLLLHPDADPTEVEEKMADVLDGQVKKEEQWFSFWLQPFTDVHLYSQGMAFSNSTRLGDIRQVRLLCALALAVLLLACFNYVNMTTARSQHRFKEVGINKTLGASTGQMIRRFYVETGILVAAAMVTGILLLEMAMPLFEGIVEKDMTILDILQSRWVWGLPATWALVTLGAGLYPALFLSSFSPKKLLSPVQQGMTGTNFFRKTLVVSQFVVCVALIAGALVFNRQLDFISNKKLGFEPEQVLAITTSAAESTDQVSSFINDISTLPAVLNACRSQAYPGVDAAGYSMSKPGQPDKSILVGSCRVSPGFEEVLGLKYLAGKTLPSKTREDTTVQIVLNEAAIEFLGYTPEEAIGKQVPDLYNGRSATIVGVVEDFHFQSLHSSIAPFSFTNGNRLGGRPYTLIKLQTDALKSTMKQLEASFSKHIPTSAFEYAFLDEHLDQLYVGEKRLSKVVMIFTLLAIFISCIGLFGLAASTTEKRTKEIGIRKVLGATTAGLVGLLSKDFIKLVLIALVIASPLAWFLMDHWLADFAYRIDIPWWVFATAGLLAVGVAFLTVSYQSVKAALSNPVDSLRSE